MVSIFILFVMIFFIPTPVWPNTASACIITKIQRFVTGAPIEASVLFAAVFSGRALLVSLLLLAILRLNQAHLQLIASPLTCGGKLEEARSLANAQERQIARQARTALLIAISDLESDASLRRRVKTWSAATAMGGRPPRAKWLLHCA